MEHLVAFEASSTSSNKDYLHQQQLSRNNGWYKEMQSARYTQTDTLPSTSSSLFPFPPAAITTAANLGPAVMTSNSAQGQFATATSSNSSNGTGLPMIHNAYSSNSSDTNKSSLLQLPQHRAMNYLAYGDTPPIPHNSILFSPAGLPPRHQPMLDDLTCPSGDYFTLVSPSGTTHLLPQNHQQHTYAQSSLSAVAPPSTCSSSPSACQPNDTLLQSNYGQHTLSPHPGYSGPFSLSASSQLSQRRRSSTDCEQMQPGQDVGFRHLLPVHSRKVSLMSTSSTSSYSSSMDSLTFSAADSPTSSSYSYGQMHASGTDANTLEHGSAVPKDHNGISWYADHQDHVYPDHIIRLQQQQQQHDYVYRPNLYFDGRQETLHRRSKSGSSVPDLVTMPLSLSAQQQQHQQQHHEEKYAQHLVKLQSMKRTTSSSGNDMITSNISTLSASPVEMTFSPETASMDAPAIEAINANASSSMDNASKSLNITPTRANFNLEAPRPHMPSILSDAIPKMDKMASTRSSLVKREDSTDQDDLDNQEDDGLLDTPMQATMPKSELSNDRQLRTRRSGPLTYAPSNEASSSPPSTAFATLPLYSQSDSHSRTHSQHQQSHSLPAIILPSKITALGSLPADEAFSASLDQLEDVPRGIKPPYLWWTLIRAAILGAPERKLQMETLTQLIQQKYPYFGSAKEAKNWKSSIRSVIHTKPCFFKSEDEAGNVWWHVDVEIDPREQRRGMKKRSSLSAGSASEALGIAPLPSPTTDQEQALGHVRIQSLSSMQASFTPLAFATSNGKHSKEESPDPNEKQDESDEGTYQRQGSSKKRRKTK